MSYIHEICRGYRKLSKAEERTLILRGDVRAKQILLMSIIPLIISMARKLANATGLSLEDFAHEGILGAYRAMTEYNPKSNTRWSSYAMNNGFVLAYMQKFIKKSELIERSVEDKMAGNHYNFLAFDSPVKEDGSCPNEFLADENAVDPSDLNVIDMSGNNFEVVLNRLPKGNAKTALMLFAEGMTCREVGAECGYSGQMAINNKEKAIKALRKILKKEGVLV
jgi:RNA polymerase sigma factor (sigma-70 family)